MGIRGDGKSYLSGALMREFLKTYPNHTVFLHDPMNCYPYTDFHTCIDIDEVIDAFESDIKRVRLAMAPPGDAVLLMDYLKEMNDIWILLDESDQMFDRKYIPESLAWIIHYGRHTNIALTMIARRPVSLPIDFTAQSIFCYSRLVEPNDFKYVKNRLGYAPESCSQYDWKAISIDGEVTDIPAQWILERN